MHTYIHTYIIHTCIFTDTICVCLGMYWLKIG